MYKRNYHPPIIVTYICRILDDKKLAQMPKTTRYNWKQFADENYWTTDYIE